MRIRQIKPGICTNEVLAELGLLATVIFERLWMVADREGRFEWRPRKLQALTIPLLKIPDEEFAKAVESLCESGFLKRYFAHGVEYAQVENWKKHQRPDSREPKSEIPAPPKATRAKRSSARTKDGYKTREKHRAARVFHGASSEKHVGNWELGTGNRSSPLLPRESLNGGDVQNAPPPPEKHPQRRAERKPPGRADGERQAPRSKPPEDHPERNHELPVTRSGTFDWWPFGAMDVIRVRESLRELGKLVGLPPPDDEIVRQVLDAAAGMDGEAIHNALVGLWKQNKFRTMRSYGLVPLVIGSQCAA